MDENLLILNQISKVFCNFLRNNNILCKDNNDHKVINISNHEIVFKNI